MPKKFILKEFIPEKKENFLCAPAMGFDYCFQVSVFIAGESKDLWSYLGGIKNVWFFPSLEF